MRLRRFRASPVHMGAKDRGLFCQRFPTPAVPSASSLVPPAEALAARPELAPMRRPTNKWQRLPETRVLPASEIPPDQHGPKFTTPDTAFASRELNFLMGTCVGSDT